VKFYGARDSAQSLVWVPYAQNAWNTAMITVRARESAAAAIQSMRQVVGELDPTIAVANVATMNETMSRSLAGDRLVAILLGVFATLALVLAAVGIFGVLSYTVAQRMRELGIRVALGAQRRDVVRLVARETTPMVLAGVVVGVIAGAALSRLFAALFYEVQAGDPLTFAGVALLLTVVAIISALVPARRASQVDAMQVLRGE
jgi:putative ABC transport system permease protein